MPKRTRAEYNAERRALYQPVDPLNRIRAACGCRQLMPASYKPNVGDTVVLSFRAVAIIDSVSTAAEGTDKFSIAYAVSLHEPIYRLKFKTLPKRKNSTAPLKKIRNFSNNRFTLVEAKGEFYTQAYRNEFYTCSKQTDSDGASAQA